MMKVSAVCLTKYERVSDFNFVISLETVFRIIVCYSFISGDSLWQDDAYQYVNPACANDALGSAKPSKSCESFLKSNEKAGIQWELERRFTAFEAKNHEKL